MPMIHSDNHDLDQLEEFMVICGVRSCEMTERSVWKNCKPGVVLQYQRMCSDVTAMCSDIS